MKKLGRFWFLFLIFLGFAFCSAAQEGKTNMRWNFRSIINLGLLEGQAGSAFQLQTLNGVQSNSWFAGLGIGLDYYRYRTIPLFLEIRKEFGKQQNKPFVYMDGGMSFS